MMTKHIRQEELDNLYQAILELKDLEDCKKFFQEWRCCLPSGPGGPG